MSLNPPAVGSKRSSGTLNSIPNKSNPYTQRLAILAKKKTINCSLDTSCSCQTTRCHCNASREEVKDSGLHVSEYELEDTWELRDELVQLTRDLNYQKFDQTWRESNPSNFIGQPRNDFTSTPNFAEISALESVMLVAKPCIPSANWFQMYPVIYSLFILKLKGTRFLSQLKRRPRI